MQLFDVNVLVYAHKEDTERHDEYFEWLLAVIDGPASYGLSELVMSGFVGIVTHPRIFDRPGSLDEAFAFLAALGSRPNAVTLRPGPRHWDIFQECCHQGRVRGSLVADAYHAALAIETGSTWITTDADFARFPALDWRHPLTS